MNSKALFTLASGSLLGASAAWAQPDYAPAHWSPITGCTKWYTSGNGHHFCVIHDMEGYYYSTISYLQNCNNTVSVYYLAHSDYDTAEGAPVGDISQSIRESNYAWHVGCWNLWMFGTEHEGFSSSGNLWYTEGMYQASALLQRHLCDTYGIPKDRNHIIAHGQKLVSGWCTWLAANYPSINCTCNSHTDPGPYWDWNHFMDLINGTVDSATVVSITAPSSVNVGQSFSATVVMNNSGSTTWTTGNGYQLGSQSAQDNTTWGFGRVALPSSISSGANATFTFTATAPSTAGSYAFAWEMLRESVHWFGGTASTTISVINPPPTITTQPASVTKDPGQTATFTVVASSTTTASYQWQKNGVGISGATSSTLTFDNVQLSDAALYTVVVSNSGGSVTSSQAQLVVTASGVAVGAGNGLQGQYYDNQDFTSLKLTRTDATVNFDWGTGSPDASIGADTFSVRWTGQVQPRYSQTYSFYTSTDDGVRLYVNGVLLIDHWADQAGTEWSGSIALTAGQPYDIQMDYYENGGAAAAHLSWSSASEAKAIIPQTQLYVSASPVIAVQPQSQTVTAGYGATFSVTAGGVLPLTYQWQFNGMDISGATLSSYTKSNVQSADGGSYTVVVTNAYGSIASSGATLTVLVPPGITTQPASQTVNQDGTVSFSVGATGTAPLAYQWRFNGTDISGATLSSYTKSNVQLADEGSYSVVVTNTAGSATSANALLTVIPSPSITTQPQSQLVGLGSTVNFTVAATGTAPLSYQWRKNGADLSNGGIFSGVTTTTLTLTDVQRTDSGTYSVLVSNPNRSVVSADALLTVSCLGDSISITLDTTLTPRSLTNDSIRNYTISGIGKISGSASLTKLGTSTLTLSTTNDYTGSNTVSAGTLLVNGSTGSGAVTVQNTATLGGSGTIGGDITVESGGLLAPGTSIGTLTISGSKNVTLNSGSQMGVEVDRNGGSPLADKVQGIGTLTEGGTLYVTNKGDTLQINDSFTLLSATTYSGEFAAICPANPNSDTELAWDKPALKGFGLLKVHHVPYATNKVMGRGHGMTAKLRLTDLFPETDPLDSDTVVLESFTAGSQGATITTNATWLFYDPVNNNNDALDFTVTDGRGGKRTKSITIYLTNSVGSVTITNSGVGQMTISFAGIPGWEYMVQRSSNLVDWVFVSTNTAPTSGLDIGRILYTETPPHSPAYYRTWRP